MSIIYEEETDLECLPFDITSSGNNETIVPETNRRFLIKYFQLNSYTDNLTITIHEEGDLDHVLFKARTKAGTIVNANLIGCEFRAKKQDRKLIVNLSGSGEVYFVVWYKNI